MDKVASGDYSFTLFPKIDESNLDYFYAKNFQVQRYYLVHHFYVLS